MVLDDTVFVAYISRFRADMGRAVGPILAERGLAEAGLEPAVSGK
jgi:hypothetical protein